MEREHNAIVTRWILTKVPNPGLSYKWTLRRGKVLTTPPVFTSSASRGATLLHHSFTRRAPRLFNSLPQALRNLPEDTHINTIKSRLDRFFLDIKDEPRIPGYYPTNSAASNRVEDQILAMECLLKDHRWYTILNTHREQSRTAHSVIVFLMFIVV